MVRETPLSPPSESAAGDAAAAALDRRVAEAARVAEGLNAVYRVEFADGRRAALKVATLATDAELLAEARFQRRVADETEVPAPAVLAAVGPEAGPLDAAHFLADYRAGRQVTDALDLSASARERLVVEAGRHLAAIHGVDVAGGFGDLRVVDGALAVGRDRGSAAEWFAERAAEAADRLGGEGWATDDDARFADLVPDVRAAFEGARDVLAGATVSPSPLHEDYRPANLVFAPRDDGDPLTRAVLDFGEPRAGDGLLDLALAEDALVDVPLGGAGRADHLREALRSAYLERRPGVALDERYPCYRLYARARRLGAFDYWVQFAREDDPGAVARRWRAFVRARLGEFDR